MTLADSFGTLALALDGTTVRLLAELRRTRNIGQALLLTPAERIAKAAEAYRFAASLGRVRGTGDEPPELWIALRGRIRRVLQGE
ncbi:MAG: hypothetical protein HYV07_27335 [Deltaproteobacteria bacterium]|nr:hypothetical protein [Deltaproteobacteria bacterium]